MKTQILSFLAFAVLPFISFSANSSTLESKGPFAFCEIQGDQKVLGYYLENPQARIEESIQALMLSVDLRLVQCVRDPATGIHYFKEIRPEQAYLNSSLWNGWYATEIEQISFESGSEAQTKPQIFSASWSAPIPGVVLSDKETLAYQRGQKLIKEFHLAVRLPQQGYMLSTGRYIMTVEIQKSTPVLASLHRMN